MIVPCPQNNGFKLRADDLQAAITERTRWVIVNNPVNPSGAVYSAEQLSEIAALLQQHPDIWILADGLYEHIVFDGPHAPTLAEIEPRLKPRTLTVSGVAKTYAMMGWRVGYAAGPAALIREMIKIQSQTTNSASSISQAAAVAALDGPQNSTVRACFRPARQAGPFCRDTEWLCRPVVRAAGRHVLSVGRLRWCDWRAFPGRQAHRDRPRFCDLPARPRRFGGSCRR